MARPRSNIVIDKAYQNLAERYYRHLLRLGYHPTSCRSRYHYICEFLSWLEQRGQLDTTTITSDQISEYYCHISCRPSKQDGGMLSQKTTHSHMRVIRDLFEMLLHEMQISINPTSSLTFVYPRDQADRAILTQSEIQALYQACITAQERAILSLAYGCGLRASEMTKCNIEDVQFKERLLIVPDGKGRKRRVIPMSSGVASDLSDYLFNEREALTLGRDYQRGERAFMLHSRGGRMRKWTYNKYLSRIIDRTDNKAIQAKKITTHSLRHSIATHLLAQGVSVEQVRQFLGHSQLETTQIYTHISEHQMKDLMR